MTKAKVVALLQTRGCKCNYSGKSTTLYVRPPTKWTLRVETFIAQETGVIPDFKIQEVYDD